MLEVAAGTYEFRITEADGTTVLAEGSITVDACTVTVNPTPVATPVETPDEGELGGTPAATPAEGELGGTPNAVPQGGSLPDTATSQFGQLPATVLSLVLIGALAAMVYVRMARQR